LYVEQNVLCQHLTYAGFTECTYVNHFLMAMRIIPYFK
jgi:hypothetical protein